ncbi:MAG: FtsH protease activity modulator HflK [Acidobacteria bacterium]|nr:MAG: FtsH protease activity modulator HflK [Acidobacteriota bacterium]
MGTIKVDFGKQLRPPQINPKIIGIIIALLVGLFLIVQTVVIVDPEEVALIIRFGKYQRTLTSGSHVKLPLLEKSIFVPVERQLKEEFGFRTAQAGRRTTYDSGNFADESLMLTGDLNVAVVDWITQYRVNDPYKYTFKVRDVVSTFRDMNEALMRTVIGDRSVTEVLTIGRDEIASEVEVRLQKLCDQYEMGIKIEQVVLQDVNPPDEVKPSFNEVNQAQQERERMINEARSAFNKVVPRARGEAQQMVTEAEGYAANRVNSAEGDAALFREVLAAYRRAPNVTRRRIYLETMEKIFPLIGRKVILDDSLEGLLPLLALQGEVPK